MTQTSQTSSEPTDRASGQPGPAGNRPARRAVLRTAGMLGAGGVGAAALAACGGSTTPTTSGGGSGGGGAAAAPSSSSSSSAGGTPFKAADVPVGGGVVNADAKVVVTQPTAGAYKAFSAVCTHQGCIVSKVADGTIHCPCHGSQFDISTGAPTSASPAKKALPAKTATLNGDTVTVA